MQLKLVFRALLIFIFFSLGIRSTAQELFGCGTAFSPSDIERIQQSYIEQDAYFKTNYYYEDASVYNIPVKFWVFSNNESLPGISEAAIQKALDSTNTFFKNAGIQFFICTETSFVVDDRYAIFDGTSQEKALTASYYQSNIFNIYLTDSVKLDGSNVCGYAYIPNGPNTIFIMKNCLVNSSTLTHELGHAFNLIHTHGSSNIELTDELVNGSNCTTAGDFICDTPADPYLPGKVNTLCKYFENEVDANGERFIPMVSNIMSYAPAKCTDEMTTEQYMRMRKSLFYNYRTELRCEQTTAFTTDKIIQAVWPNPFEKVLQGTYYLPAKTGVIITLYNTQGQEVAQLQNMQREAGLNGFYYSFHQYNLPSGIYFLTLFTSSGKSETFKLEVIND